MKKTVIALAIAALAAAGTSSAATVYNQDGTKVELGGSARIFLGKVGHDFDKANFGTFSSIHQKQIIRPSSLLAANPLKYCPIW